MGRRNAGITLVEVTAGVTVLGIIVALLIPAIARGSRFKKVVECDAHLRAMYHAQTKAPAPKLQELGMAYWVRLTEANPPLLSKDLLRCPLVDASASIGCDYLGPAADPTNFLGDEPIGCDLQHSHSEDAKEGGNVLLKSGQVVTDRTGIWGSAIRKCRP